MVKNKTLRILLIIAGSISLFLGIIGIFLPLLPTTPFIILTAYCYARGSKKLHQYLLHQKYFGQIIRDFEQNRIIRRKNKIIALVTMWTSLLLSIIFFMPYLWIKGVVVLIGISVTIYIIRFPSDN